MEFEYKELDEEGINILNLYHKEFMDREVIPYVTKTLDSKKTAEQSLKTLKRIPSIDVNVDLPVERYKHLL